MTESDTLKKEIGLRLKQARKEKKLTQDQLSERIGISQKHYSEAERGMTGLSIEHYVKLSNVLNLSLDYLFKGEKPAQPSEPVQNFYRLNEIYFSASEQTQRHMLRLVQIAQDIEYQARN